MYFVSGQEKGGYLKDFHMSWLDKLRLSLLPFGLLPLFLF